MNTYKAFALASVALLIIVAAASFFVYPTSAPEQYGYMSQGQLSALAVPEANISVNGTANSIYVSGPATILVETGPMKANVSMYSFEISGMINPEIVVKQGVELKFVVVNVDSDASHNFVITSASPPYTYMSGSGMMGGGNTGMYGSSMMLSPGSGGNLNYYNMTSTFSSTGTLWYLCTYPGHAQNGMYGKISVIP
ncbi:MAG: plastocyanin/azurin family copper-binding protein [Candidatus Thermoplasmatota archaeon]|nr:plastocyanin/azurin family copper-binding protein [Candidatus Thermoplasmatota archaeon]